MRYFFFLLGLIAFGFWIFFPKIFKWWVSDYLIDPPISFDAYTALGPIGDIFGGLTAFFTSLTLIIVLYSAYLQRQANKDAREAMSDQLKQAKEASAEQLRQAKESTKQQLDLAEATRDAQIKESQNAIFTTKFYSLLNFKNERLNQIKLNIYGDNKQKVQVDGVVAISKMCKIFLDELYKNEDVLVSYNHKQLLEHFKKVIPTIFIDLVNPVISYFYIYGDIIRLINEADISLKDREFFKSILRNSMFQEEQMVFFWIAAIFDQLNISLKDSELFNQFHRPRFHKYGLKFHKKSHFKSKTWKDLFDEKQAEE
ncbi:DUF4398 domain-containing protein [Acinetobacter sp. 11520]|nr:DUF4398 domain-containing protein [Acinetobacter sp. 11520]